jgi:hypothetical protein
LATACPIPWAVPVTTATIPSSSAMIYAYLSH